MTNDASFIHQPPIFPVDNIYETRS